MRAPNIALVGIFRAIADVAMIGRMDQAPRTKGTPATLARDAEARIPSTCTKHNMAHLTRRVTVI